MIHGDIFSYLNCLFSAHIWLLVSNSTWFVLVFYKIAIYRTFQNCKFCFQNSGTFFTIPFSVYKCDILSFLLLGSITAWIFCILYKSYKTFQNSSDDSRFLSNEDIYSRCLMKLFGLCSRFPKSLVFSKKWRPNI